MKFTVTHEELKEKLALIKGISAKSPNPITKHFLLDVGSDGVVLTATDIETSIRVPLKTELQEEGSLCLPTDKMFGIASLAEGNIVLNSEKTRVRVKHSGVSYGIPYLPKDEFPEWPNTEESTAIKVGASVLKTTIEKTIVAVDVNALSRMPGLFFESGQTGLVLAGTDGYFLSSAEITGDFPEKKFTISYATAKHLKGLLPDDGDITILAGESMVVFNLPEIEFYSRLLNTPPMPYRNIIPKDDEKGPVVSVNREALLTAIKRISSIGRPAGIDFTLDLGGLVLNRRCKDDEGEATAQVTVDDYKGENLRITFAPQYILNALSGVEGNKATLELSKLNEKLNLYGMLRVVGESDDLNYYIAPQHWG